MKAAAEPLASRVLLPPRPVPTRHCNPAANAAADSGTTRASTADPPATGSGAVNSRTGTIRSRWRRRRCRRAITAHMVAALQPKANRTDLLVLLTAAPKSRRYPISPADRRDDDLPFRVQRCGQTAIAAAEQLKSSSAISKAA